MKIPNALSQVLAEFKAALPEKIQTVLDVAREPKPDLEHLEFAVHKLTGSTGIYGHMELSNHLSSLKTKLEAKEDVLSILPSWSEKLESFIEKRATRKENLNVLLAEDDHSIQSITKIALEKVGGHKVTTASDGKETLTKLSALSPSEMPDLILLDVMMPELDGFETCKRLKADPKTAGIPVIFLTAKAQATETQNGMNLGAEAYILKPFDPIALVHQIRDLLKEDDAAAA